MEGRKKEKQTERHKGSRQTWTPTSCDLGHDRRCNSFSWNDRDRGRKYSASVKLDEGLSYMSKLMETIFKTKKKITGEFFSISSL